MNSWVGQRNHVLDVVRKGKWQFSGVIRAIQKHWQTLLQQLLLLRCDILCKTDHSVANNLIQQKGSFSISGKCR